MKFEKIALAGLLTASGSVSGQKAENFQSVDIKNNQTEIINNTNKEDISKDYHVSNDELVASFREVNNSKIDNLKNSMSKDYFKKEALKYKEYGMFMSCNLASEKPNEYQEKKIKELQDSVISKLNGLKFKNTSELIMYINQSINCNFSDNKTSIYIKDAFPEKEGEEPKGSFDCDSRSIITLSILEKIGIPNDNVGFYVMEGHALLKDKIENTFIEMTTNKISDFNKDEQIQLEEINSFDKFYSYLLAKEGAALSYEADGGIFDSSKTKDEEKMKLSLEKLKEASDLDPDNITTNLNLLKVLKKTNIDSLTLKSISSKASSNIQKFLINNYYGTSSDVSNKEHLIKTDKVLYGNIGPRKLEDLGDIEDLTSKAISKSDYLQSKFFDLGSDMYYDFDNKEEALKIFSSLAKSIDLNSLDKNKEKIGSYLLYQRYISKCYFNSGKYEDYLKFINMDLMNLQSRVSRDTNLPEYITSQIKNDIITQDSEIVVANILSGKIKINKSTINNFCDLYKDDPIINCLIEGGNINSIYMDANEALMKWSGYQDLVNLINSWKNNKN